MKKIFFWFCILLSFSSCSEDQLEEALYTEIEQLTNGFVSDYELAYQFAPELRFHKCEMLWPTDPTWFFDKVDLKFSKKGNDRLINKRITNENIHTQSFTAGFLSCRKYEEQSGSGYPSNFYLQIKNNRDEIKARYGNSDLSNLKILMSVREHAVYSGIKSIQYWFFYPFNALCPPRHCCSEIESQELDTECGIDGAHEADWEHITVEYNTFSQQVEQVFMSAHDTEGRYYSPNEIEWIDQHPVVYAALGSHASYNKIGSFDRTGFRPNDYTGNGRHVKTWELENYFIKDCYSVGCLDNPTAPNWLKYSGFWGELGATTFNPVGGDAPRGPAYKLSFFDDYEAIINNSSCDYANGRGIVFWEKENCQGNRWFTTDISPQYLSLKNRWKWKNDEIKSVSLSNVKAGTQIYLYDNSFCKKEDDFTLIEVKKDIGFHQLIKVNDLEKTAQHRHYDLTYQKNNGLAGKISYIKITNSN